MFPLPSPPAHLFSALFMETVRKENDPSDLIRRSCLFCHLVPAQTCGGEEQLSAKKKLAACLLTGEKKRNDHPYPKGTTHVPLSESRVPRPRQIWAQVSTAPMFPLWAGGTAQRQDRGLGNFLFRCAVCACPRTCALGTQTGPELRVRFRPQGKKNLPFS